MHEIYIYLISLLITRKSGDYTLKHALNLKLKAIVSTLANQSYKFKHYSLV